MNEEHKLLSLFINYQHKTVKRPSQVTLIKHKLKGKVLQLIFCFIYFFLRECKNLKLTIFECLGNTIEIDFFIGCLD